VDEALLGEFVLVGYTVEIKAGTKIFFAALQRFDILCVIFLEKNRSLGRRPLLSHSGVRIGSIR
jgi:hypothetical protein